MIKATSLVCRLGCIVCALVQYMSDKVLYLLCLSEIRRLFIWHDIFAFKRYGLAGFDNSRSIGVNFGM